MRKTLTAFVALAAVAMSLVAAGCKTAGGSDGPSVKDLQSAGPEGVKAQMQSKGKASGKGGEAADPSAK